MASSPPPLSTDEEYHINFVKNSLAGVMAASVCLAVYHKLPEPWIPITLFAGSLLGAAVSTFIECVFKNEGWCRCLLDSLLAAFSGLAGGVLSMILGMVVSNRKVRIAVLVVSSALVSAVLILNWVFRMFAGGERRTTRVPVFCVWLLVMVGISIFVTIADRVK